LEVRRNYGKPNTAAQILEKLRAEKKKGKKAGAATVAAPESEVVVKPAPAHADDLHAIAETIRKENEAAAPAESQTPQKSQTTVSAKPARKARNTSALPTEGAKSEPSEASVTPAVAPPAAQAPVAKPAAPHTPLNTRGMQPKHVVEAALFSAGKPIAIEDIVHETKLSPEAVKKAIKELAADYDERDTVLEVGKAGTKWAMQVRSRAAEPAARFAPMEIAPKLLKTLALIAYHQPMKQSELVNMIGTKVYEHIPELIERGLVRAREDGPTKILQTTPAFPEYFGLDAEDPEQVRMVMGKLVGIEAPPKPKAESVTYVEEQAQAAPADAPASQGPPPA